MTWPSRLDEARSSIEPLRCPSGASLAMGTRCVEEFRAGGAQAEPTRAFDAQAHPSCKQCGVQVGFASYLTKPVNVGEFVRTLETLLAAVQ